jgi:hypothetical protein
MDETKKVLKKQSSTTNQAALLSIVLWVAVGLVIGLGVYYLFLAVEAPPTPPKDNITPPTPNITPPAKTKVNITLIEEARCPQCESTSLLLDQIKAFLPQAGLEIDTVSTLKSSDTGAKQLISKYSIKKLPSMIVSKEAGTDPSFEQGWSNVGGVKESDGAFVYKEVYPPYFDLDTESIIGFVEVIEITADCLDCYNTSSFVDYLESENVGMHFTNKTNYAANSSEAEILMKKYNITKLPAFFLSGQASAYPPINITWTQYGSIESDGWYVYRGTIPPYMDLEKNSSIQGLVALIEIVDPTCVDCYDVSLHKESLGQSFGMVFSSTTRANTTSKLGQELIALYNITKVPTVILSSDALIYQDFNDTWSDLGSYEADGSLVFRELDAIKVTYSTINQTTNTSANSTN